MASTTRCHDCRLPSETAAPQIHLVSPFRRFQTTFTATGRLLVGIPELELARVFERFYKSPESPGSGLGLSIAKSLVEAHGGTIGAANRPGGGTVVSVVLPVI